MLLGLVVVHGLAGRLLGATQLAPEKGCEMTDSDCIKYLDAQVCCDANVKVSDNRSQNLLNNPDVSFCTMKPGRD